jgi:hypothetical protein
VIVGGLNVLELPLQEINLEGLWGVKVNANVLLEVGFKVRIIPVLIQSINRINMVLALKGGEDVEVDLLLECKTTELVVEERLEGTWVDAVDDFIFWVVQ